MQKRTIAFNSELGECRLLASASIEEAKSSFLKFITNNDLIDEGRYYQIKDSVNVVDALTKKIAFKRIIIEPAYNIYSPNNIHIGIIALLYDERLDQSPRVVCYLSNEFSKTNLLYDSIQGLINYFFDNNYLDAVTLVVFDANKNTGISKYISQFKLNPTHQPILKYDLSRYDWGLKFLSEIFVKENRELLPQIYDLANINMERARRLWYAYFCNGIALCNGGVESSIFTFSQFMRSPNLQKFNMYPVDRSESIQLKPRAVLKFLIEEKLLDINTRHEDIHTSFCLGSHEGFTRIARSIMSPGENDGIFFPACGYGFSATAAATLKPAPFKFSLIDCDIATGEKIIIPKLRFLLIKNPTYRTLFIELKTTAGAVYNEHEIRKIIRLCKQYNCFIIFDCAHLNMNFDEHDNFPFTANLCLEENYHQFAVLYTGSKTYGFERGRIGFIAISGKSTLLNKKISEDYKTIFGTVSDIHYEITHALMGISKEARLQYIKAQNEKHRRNMSLMIAYVNGVKDPMIDSDLRNYVAKEVPPYYQNGIPGLRVTYKPTGAIQLKVSMYDLRNMYVANIKMFNSEIFCYALNKLFGVVTLNAFQVMDSEGYTLRLSFSVSADVHDGMKRMHQFVSSLNAKPSTNRFTPEIQSMQEYINLKRYKSQIPRAQQPANERQANLWSVTEYRNNLKKQLPSYVEISEENLDLAVIKAATKIQRSVRKFLDGDLPPHTPKSKL